MFLKKISKTVFATNPCRKHSGGVESEELESHSFGPYLPSQETRNKSLKKEQVQAFCEERLYLFDKAHFAETL